MRALVVTVAALVAGCGEPAALSCVDDSTCGAGGVCVAGFCAEPDPLCASGLRYHESAGSLAGDCTIPPTDGKGDGDGTGTGTDTGPADVYRLLELNSLDAASARDDIAPSCAAPGGKDVMFDVTVGELGRLYVDTYGTSYGVVLAIYSGRCAALASAGKELACVKTSCGPTTQQWSDILAPGDYCVVVDQLNAAEQAGALVVRSKLGLPSPYGDDTGATNLLNVGSTCGPNRVQATCNASSAGDASWFFMTCGQLRFTADSCDDNDFRGYVTALGLGSTPLACVPGCAPPYMDLAFRAPSPIWVVADDITSMACGAVQIYVATAPL